MGEDKILLAVSEHNLSFAVNLYDDFSRQGFLIGQTKVFLKEKDMEAFRNPSGYFIFMDLIGERFTLRIENKNYFDKEIEVVMGDLDPKYPVVNVTLKPCCLYPFPRGSTSIRGRLLDNDGSPISDASINIFQETISNQSESDGRFVLYFGPLTEDDLKIQNSRRYVEVQNSTVIKLRAEHPDYKAKTLAIGEIEEGETKLLTEPILLDQKQG